MRLHPSESITVPAKSLLCRDLSLRLRLRKGRLLLMLTRKYELLRLAFAVLQLREPLRLRTAPITLSFQVRYTVTTDRPHLIFVDASLPFLMLERTERLRAWVVPALDLRVCEFAARDVAVRAVPAQGHVWMSERAIRVRAIRVELAVDLLLQMLCSLCW